MLLVAECGEGAKDAAEKGFRGRLLEQETGFAVIDGVRQAPGAPSDRQRPEPLRIHLAETARFKARRHHDEIAAGKDAARFAGIEADRRRDGIGALPLRLVQRLLEFRLTLA